MYIQSYAKLDSILMTTNDHGNSISNHGVSSYLFIFCLMST